ncbi:MAG: hypothetical protein ASARMPREDX12_005850 [Alectoria sarmentosa]|nr:MAG: hypothetical protein ASARMPREDX12_005850 [Alectoria sarmentosa]
MAKSIDGRTKQKDYYIDSDAEDAEQKHIKQHIYSQKDHMTIAQENREMKSIIQRLQTQLRQETHTSYRLRQLRDQYRSTAKELTNQMTRLQPKKKKEMYDSNDENKESIKKKIESLLRHTKKGLKNLTRQGFAPVSPALNTNLTGQGFAPASPPFHTKSDLNDLTDPRSAPVSPPFHSKTNLKGLADPRFAPVSQRSNKYYPNVPEFYGDASKWEA